MPDRQAVLKEQIAAAMAKNTATTTGAFQPAKSAAFDPDDADHEEDLQKLTSLFTTVANHLRPFFRQYETSLLVDTFRYVVDMSARDDHSQEEDEEEDDEEEVAETPQVAPSSARLAKVASSSPFQQAIGEDIYNLPPNYAGTPSKSSTLKQPAFGSPKSKAKAAAPKSPASTPRRSTRSKAASSLAELTLTPSSNSKKRKTRPE